MNHCLLIVHILISQVHLCMSVGDVLTCGTPPMCCPRYQNDLKHNLCSKCLSGYQGPNCSYACRYPNYGDDCQSFCDCVELQCDHITGCRQLSELHNCTTKNPHMTDRSNSRMMTISVCILMGVFILIIGFYFKVKSMQSTYLTYSLQFREQNTNKMSDTRLLSSNV
nr:N-acetylglucosamine-1-phosphodiester alpha-N-acetylglucosaminidase-like [Crassostrea gigas]